MAIITVSMVLSDETVVGSYSKEVDDTQLQQAIGAFAASQGYQAVFVNPLDDSETPNPETAGNFLIRKEKEFTEAVIKSYLANQAADAARQQVLDLPSIL